ncbi:unnamed protein product [Linum trigynum]|uniref:Reverse transcriptase domain-containing protein n=1 Tax=Linum trigynum TaxID=586398 RepID=A0AAV2DI81_9ROSI
MFRLWCKLKALRHRLYEWSKLGKSNSERKIRSLQREWDVTRGAIDVDWGKLREIESHLRAAWVDEEIYWRQKSRVGWLKEGDQNSSYFHNVTRARRRHNCIHSLKDPAGNSVTSEEGKALIANDFYTHLFTSGGLDSQSVLEKVGALQIERRVTDRMNSRLTAEVSPEEIRNSVFQIGATQAPGSDGFTGVFYRKFWEIVGPDVIMAVRHFFDTGSLLKNCNHTWLVLLPKVDNAENMRDLRPISLCQFAYKIIAKILAERLARYLPSIVSPGQNGFVRGRQIVDNVLIGHEVMQYLKNKRVGKQSFMAVKVDMEKAYDRVEWPFLFALLEKLGFSAQWIRWLWVCVSSSSFSVLMNGQPSGYFQTSRGLRQGDPLSPLLFAICTEGFAALLRQALSSRALSGLRISPRCPVISHLFFADDSYLFLRASRAECASLMVLLHQYEELSGQKVNLDKSAVCFSRNVLPRDAQEMGQLLGIGAIGVTDQYLGLPSLVGRSKYDTFRYIEERVIQKLQGWKQQCLSWAAKEVLLKAVANALPIYGMSCFLFPLTLCRSLDRHLARFWWGVKQGERRIHWVSWKAMCLGKQEGGLGFRRFEEFNQALLAKVAWRIWKDPNSLLARVYKGKYFPNSSILSARTGSLTSWGWRGILRGRDLLLQGLRWQIGSGDSVEVLTDNWVPALHPFPPKPRQGIIGVEGKVASLICPNQGVWRVDCLRQIFEEDTVKAILAIPLPIKVVPDRLVWDGEISGCYTVKSGYHKAVELRRQKELQVKAVALSWDRSLWKRIWATPIPPKLRYFIWQLVRGVLPTGEALSTRGMEGLEPCPVCGEEVESLEHLFFRCRVALQLWEGAELHLLRDRFPLNNISIFWRRVLEEGNLDRSTLMRVVALFWRVWRARNWVVFDFTQFIVPVLLSQFRSQVTEWDSVPDNQQRPPFPGPGGPRLAVRESVPPGELVLFVDGATLRGSHGAGGWVLQDPSGVVVAP